MLVVFLSIFILFVACVCCSQPIIICLSSVSSCLCCRKSLKRKATQVVHIKKLTGDEIKEWTNYRMKIYDTNQNGFLEMEECRRIDKLIDNKSAHTYNEKQFQEEFAIMDVNKDGKIGWDELYNHTVRKHKEVGRFAEP